MSAGVGPEFADFVISRFEAGQTVALESSSQLAPAEDVLAEHFLPRPAVSRKVIENAMRQWDHRDPLSDKLAGNTIAGRMTDITLSPMENPGHELAATYKRYVGRETLDMVGFVVCANLVSSAGTIGQVERPVWLLRRDSSYTSNGFWLRYVGPGQGSDTIADIRKGSIKRAAVPHLGQGSSRRHRGLFQRLGDDLAREGY